jgi:hypothetical protein
MPQQRITAELRRWIIDQATAGHPVDVVLDAMKASGWVEAVALDAVETTMRGHRGLPADGDVVAAVGSARPMPGAPIGRRCAPAIATSASSWRWCRRASSSSLTCCRPTNAPS